MMLKGPIPPSIPKPIVSSSGEGCILNAEASGVIIPLVKHPARVSKGDLLCRIVDPFEGTVLQDVLSPVDGLIFFSQQLSLVHQDAIMLKISAI